VGSVVADDDGIIVETTVAAEEAQRLGMTLEQLLDNGNTSRKA